MHRFALATLTLALVSAPAAAYADSIVTQTVTTGAFSATNSLTEDTFSVNGFNPALGTLISVAVNLSGSYTLTGASGSVQPSFIITVPDSGATIADKEYFEPNGTYTAYLSGNDAFASALQHFISAGKVTPGFSVDPDGAAIRSVAGFTGTLTYDYTPASPVAVTPEPSSLALLGTGVLGLIGVARKRFA